MQDQFKPRYEPTAKPPFSGSHFMTRSIHVSLINREALRLLDDFLMEAATDAIYLDAALKFLEQKGLKEEFYQFFKPVGD